MDVSTVTSKRKAVLNQSSGGTSKTETMSRSLQDPAGEKEENLRVIVRVRPLMQREALNGVFVSTADVGPDGKSISLYEYFNLELVPPERVEQYIEDPESYQTHTFTFDRVYDESASQEEIYETTAQSAVFSALEVRAAHQGYNATLLAYGQTGTGKTYTMEGFKYNGEDPQRGIIPRAIEDIFEYIREEGDPETTFMVRCSYLQIYNENISDLLKTERQNLQIREKKKGVFVEGLSEWAVRSPSEIYALMKKGATSRATASTNMNDVSSRSHAVFIVTIEQLKHGTLDARTTKVSKLNLVDLAGSERIRITGAKGVRLEECKKINQSLSALGHVIAALTDLSKKSRSHIPYRDSKLTRILEDSLGGNCRTTFMAMISPAVCAFGESVGTAHPAHHPQVRTPRQGHQERAGHQRRPRPEGSAAPLRGRAAETPWRARSQEQEPRRPLEATPARARKGQGRARQDCGYRGLGSPQPRVFPGARAEAAAGGADRHDEEPADHGRRRRTERRRELPLDALYAKRRHEDGPQAVRATHRRAGSRAPEAARGTGGSRRAETRSTATSCCCRNKATS